MTYVGAVPTTGDFKKLDSITTSSATTFNLRQGGVAVYPQSANHCIVSLNGVIQAPVDAFTIVNDTIVFASSLASSDVIDFILVLGNVNDIGTPSDDSVSQAKIQSEAINEAKIQISNAGTNGQFLSKQSGNTGGLTWADAGGGIEAASQWRLTTSFTGDKSPINANWEQVDAPVGFGILGSAMTESSGIFTFPSTGYWYVGFHLSVFSDSQGATAYIEGEIETTTNNSTYAVAANPRLNLGGNSYSMSTYGSFIKDVTNTSNDKVRFDVNTNAGTVIGNTGYNRTYVVFIRLGDT